MLEKEKNGGRLSEMERNLKVDNITVKRLHCSFPRNVFSVIEEQNK